MFDFLNSFWRWTSRAPPPVRARACVDDRLAFFAAIGDAQPALLGCADRQPGRLSLADFVVECDPEPCP